MLAMVENRIARALPVFKIERFACVMPIFSASSPEEIFLFAIITSRLTTIAIFVTYIVSSFSAFISIAERKTFLMTRKISEKKAAATLII